jgi:CHAT domain-containing protein/Tfp pilus assembly protein PilF
MNRIQVILIVTLFILTGLSDGNAAQHQGRESKAGAADRGSGKEPGNKGEAKGSLDDLEARAQEAEKENRWQEASIAYQKASHAARVNGQFQKAVSYGNKALEMGERAQGPLLQARAILSLVDSYKRLGQKAQIRPLLEKGIEIVKRIPSGGPKLSMEANIYSRLGVELSLSGETQKAIETMSYSLQVLGSNLSFMQSHGASQNVQRIQKAHQNMAETLDRLGNAYKNQGNMDEAIKSYEKGLAIFQSAKLKAGTEDKLYQKLGQLYLGQKDFPRALENLTRALGLADKNQHANVIQQASSGIADILRQSKRPAEAIPFYKKAIDSIERSRSLLESEEFRSSFFEDKRQTYAGMILAYLGDGQIEEAFNYNERARSRAFLDILGNKVQLAHGALLEEERALQARISALQAGMKVAEEGEEDEEDEENVPQKSDPKQELEQAQKAYNDFLAKVRKENKEQASLMNVEPLTLKQTQEFLESGVTVLEYFVVRDQVLLWVVERDRVQFVRARLGRNDLASKVKTLRESVFQLGEKEKFKASSQEIYKLLIEPALPHIRGKELLLVPHDVLHYLPFQALMSSQGKYLVQDYPIYYLSSASLMQFTREKRRAGGERALVMGNPSLGDEAYNLRFAEREAKEVASVYPQSAVFLRAEASKTRVMSLSPKYDMLHFAVHAELNEEDPMSSALLLAPEGGGDGRLKVGEIFSLNLKTNMVVLSACETGLGKLSNGDELVGLTRAFIYAGTPSIVTTLWKVNDRASYELMREFYQHLKTAKKSEALRQAQLKTMQEFPEPFYWAAYQLTGEP